MAVPAVSSVQPDADRAVDQVRRWIEISGSARPRAGARIMDHALRTDGGLRYLTEVVDSLVRPEDPRVAAAALRRASADAPAPRPTPRAGSHAPARSPRAWRHD
ncbi:MAG: hypothetical protein ACK4MD_10645 [Demequina sp.]